MMKRFAPKHSPAVAALIVLPLLALACVSCVPTDASMSADGSTLATQVAEQVLTFVFDFARQALAAFLL